DFTIDLLGGGLDLRFGLARTFLLRILGKPGGLGARRIHASTPRSLGLFRLHARSLGALEVLGDLLLARVDRRLNLRKHPPADAEEDDSEYNRQPEELREEYLRKLRNLRHRSPRLSGHYAISARRE